MTARDLVLFICGAALPSLAVAYLAAWVLRRFAPQWGLIDQPNAARKVHTTPTPLGGGLAIWAGVLAAFGAASLLATLPAHADDEDRSSRRDRSGGRTHIAFDFDFGSAIDAPGSKSGGGGALRLGEEFDLLLVTLTPEIGGSLPCVW